MKTLTVGMLLAFGLPGNTVLSVNVLKICWDTHKEDSELQQVPTPTPLQSI